MRSDLEISDPVRIHPPHLGRFTVAMALDYCRNSRRDRSNRNLLRILRGLLVFFYWAYVFGYVVSLDCYIPLVWCGRIFLSHFSSNYLIKSFFLDFIVCLCFRINF